MYTITDVGREMLHDMLAELPPDQADDDTELAAARGAAWPIPGGQPVEELPFSFITG
ncbi:MAG: hypothetical protein JO242_14660 [Streptosporangiaceae bacterium]|nr:hypothetical protein [Streptosporangiaceae bacterium]